MQPISVSLSPRLLGSSLLTAPLLFGTSTFFWQDGEYGVTGGTILVLSTVFWIPAFLALFNLLKGQMPLYTSVGLLVAIYGCVSGMCFGLVGVFSAVFGISHQTYLHAAAAHPLSFNLLLFWSGPLFPLSILVLGINLLRKRAVPTWVGLLLMAGAVIFPVSRIPRIEIVAHVADVLMAIPLVYIGLHHYFNFASHAQKA